MRPRLLNIGGCILLALLVFGLLLTGCSSGPTVTGVLEGKVTIGPLTPVETPGGTPVVPCEVYEARKVLVYDQNGTDLIKTVSIDCSGRYRVELKPGVYTVDINHVGIDRSSDVPKKIEIKAGITTELDIDIDTGIR